MDDHPNRTAVTLSTRLDTESGAKDAFTLIVRSPKSPEARALLDMIRQAPEAALEALARGDHALGLTNRGGADAMEAILGAIDNDHLATELVPQRLSIPRIAELLVGRGDLPAILVHVAPREAIIEGIRLEMALAQQPEATYSGDYPDDPYLGRLDAIDARLEELEEPDAIDARPDGSSMGPDPDDGEEILAQDPIAYAEASSPPDTASLAPPEVLTPECVLAILGWYEKLTDRPDLDSLLQASVFGGITLRGALLLGIWANSGCPRKLARIPEDVLAEYGFDHECLSELKQLIAIVGRWGADDVEFAQEKLGQQRQTAEEAGTTLGGAMKQADNAAEKLDL